MEVTHIKIKISYQADEQEKADQVTELLKETGFKPTKSDRYTPFLHTYLVDKNGKKPHK